MLSRSNASIKRLLKWDLYMAERILLVEKKFTYINTLDPYSDNVGTL